MQAIIKISLLIFISTILLAISIMFFYDPQNVIDTVNEEKSNIRQELGSEAVLEIVKLTDKAFLTMEPAIRVTTGFLYEKGDPSVALHPGLENTAFKLRNWYQGVVETFWNLVYQSLLRVFTAAEISGFFLVLLVPSLVDGMVLRKIKTSSFRFTSPLFYQLSFIGLATTISLFVLILTVPIAIPFWTYICWVLVFSYFVRGIASNTQKMF